MKILELPLYIIYQLPTNHAILCQRRGGQGFTFKMGEYKPFFSLELNIEKPGYSCAVILIFELSMILIFVLHLFLAEKCKRKWSHIGPSVAAYWNDNMTKTCRVHFVCWFMLSAVQLHYSPSKNKAAVFYVFSCHCRRNDVLRCVSMHHTQRRMTCCFFLPTTTKKKQY